jgi:hypothetical protein
MLEVTRRRAIEVVALRRQGAGLRAIAHHIGVSIDRVRQLIVQGCEVERQQASGDPWEELSFRVRNALVADGCEPTLDGVRACYRTVYGRPRGLWSVPYIGKKSIAEVQAWLCRHGKEAIPLR